MTKYLAGVLTVIAAGVLLVAYGLFNPRTAMDAASQAAMASPGGAGDLVSLQAPAGAGAAPYGYVAAPPAGYGPVPVSYLIPAPAPQAAVAYAQPAVATVPAPSPARAVSYSPAPRAVSRRVEARPKSDWKRTAMIIGGSSAAGAGVGAIFGGKKGALIGAAIGGGASTIYQVAK